MITIINYGLGNIKAFVNVYKQLNIPVIIVSEPNELRKARKIILPGVGAFDYAMSRLNASGMRETLDELVKIKKVPILGVCVGMQMMAESSEEGKLPGLGWIPGKVIKFDEKTLHQKTHLPHMGWNDVEPLNNNPLFNNLEHSARFYFLHSYYYHCVNPIDSIAFSHYGIDFTCAVKSENVYGVQFHPEKSHHWGYELLKNFSELKNA
jgi:imidazole glycerol-phosphate synthase subunit HisH